MRFPLLLVLSSALITPLQSQEATPAPLVSSMTFRPGQLVERVTSSLDRAQQYAVYLPSNYRTDGKVPVLLLLDPRGRALVPMNLVKVRAERHGYLVLSSYNTQSDGDNQPNLDAMAAMLTDVQRTFAVDRTRFYLVGFSGTARVSWEFAYGLRGTVAGVLGFGAGVTPGFNFAPAGFSGPIPFAFYGGSGTSDFNYEEMLSLDDELDRLGMTHRLQYYDGPHAWPPVHVMEDAIDWMELQAMRKDLAPRNAVWIDSLFTAALARARELESAGESFAAWRQYRNIAADFAGVSPVAPVEARAAELEKSPGVKKAIRAQAEMIERNHAYLRKLGQFLQDYRSAKSPPSLEKSLKTLQVVELKKAKADTRDTLAAMAAGRLLEHVEVFSSFYEPRDYMERGDPARALAMLELAESVSPGPGICQSRAEALEMLKRPEEAAKARECDILAHP